MCQNKKTEKGKETETFWDGYLAGFITVIVILSIGIAICHFCGHPVIILDQ